MMPELSFRVPEDITAGDREEQRVSASPFSCGVT